MEGISGLQSQNKVVLCLNHNLNIKKLSNLQPRLLKCNTKNESSPLAPKDIRKLYITFKNIFECSSSCNQSLYREIHWETRCKTFRFRQGTSEFSSLP